MSVNFEKNMLNTAKRELLHLYKSGVSAVLPHNLIKEKVKIFNNTMIIGEKQIPLKKNVYIIGFGKAVAGMAIELEKALGSKLRKGILSIPYHSLQKSINSQCTNTDIYENVSNAFTRTETECDKSKSVIEYCEGGKNNQPDKNSLLATKKIIELADSLTKTDTLIVLISGGGSALLCQPIPEISIDVKLHLCQKLQNSGANILELNRVRKQLSLVKGGGLARMVYPCSVVSLILSDIIGNPINLIASGPTCPQTDSPEEATQILKKYSLYNCLNTDLQKRIIDKNTNLQDCIIENGKFKHVENILIGSNSTALEAISKAAKRINFQTIILSDRIDGDVRDVSLFYVKVTKLICLLLQGILSKDTFIKEIVSDNFKISHSKATELFEIIRTSEKEQAILLIMGGEPTVVVKGSGKGGRSQELALKYSVDWYAEISKNPHLQKYFALMLSAGSDGQDGPTDAAGAFGTACFPQKMLNIHKKLHYKLVKKQKCKELSDAKELHVLRSKLAQIQDMFPESVLDRNDSYNFFSKFENGSNLIKTGLTGTNVMDFHLIYIKRNKVNCKIDNSKNCNFIDEDKNEEDFLFTDQPVTHKSKL